MYIWYPYNETIYSNRNDIEGRSRSLAMAQFNRLHRPIILYQWSVTSMRLSRMVYETEIFNVEYWCALELSLGQGSIMVVENGIIRYTKASHDCRRPAFCPCGRVHFRAVWRLKNMCWMSYVDAIFTSEHYGTSDHFWHWTPQRPSL